METEERVFSALADATRRDLLMKLAESSPQTATEFSRSLPITRQGILKHLNQLEEAGLVASRHRGREKLFWFAPDPLDEVGDWLKRIEKEWDQRLTRLKRHIEGS